MYHTSLVCVRVSRPVRSKKTPSHHHTQNLISSTITKMSVNILVVDYDSSHDWYAAFRGKTVLVGGVQCKINVEQTAFEHISLSASGEAAVLDIEPSPDPILGSSQKNSRRFIPDFCLIRNVARGVHGRDYRNILYGLHYAGVGSVNSLSSIISCQERAVVYAELMKLNREMGDMFPFIPAVYHANLDDSTSIATTAFPSVVKIGPSCAGYGKLKADSATAFRDIRTTMSMMNDYFTVEPFQEAVCDVRVQKIGNTIRSFTRQDSLTAAIFFICVDKDATTSFLIEHICKNS